MTDHTHRKLVSILRDLPEFRGIDEKAIWQVIPQTVQLAAITSRSRQHTPTPGPVVIMPDLSERPIIG